MLTIKPSEHTNVIEFELDGGLSREEFDLLAARIEQVISEYGEVRIIEVVKHVGAISPSALWADFKFAPKHLKDFSHVAIVADQKWIGWFSELVKPLMHAEIRNFGLDELDQARYWIRNVTANV
ncbi:STAS/SEC14 domain-containing protein [Pseudomonas segetis]|uniref:SpoIIAA-like n=1 Tax=Pseudomonas segetis TaxID=298908 RepID=A0A238ZV62_9PSED|nr:STAS/SEC14 domain-containing protein [Pseudomonas segetis]SNR87297.1 SpoIIAA-like [Pseudomonas segetis]